MNRRSFLAWLGGTAAGVALAPTLDLDKLLWQRGARTHFDIRRPSGLWASESLPVREIFTIDGHYAVNPLTVFPLGFLQNFVVTRDVSAGHVSQEDIFPPIVTRGPYTNVHRTVPTHGLAVMNRLQWGKV